MRIIKSATITEAVKKLALDTAYFLPHDVVQSLKFFAGQETNKRAKTMLYKIIENHKLSKKGTYPLCQDTGMAVIFLELGDEVKVEGDIYAAINEGIKQGYGQGCLRKSIADPINRHNTGTNTPAIIHIEIIKGTTVKIYLMAKGAGSENKSALKMMTPSAGIDGIKQFVIDTVKSAGASACPPYIIGVGIGGNFETAPLLAKKSLLREIGLNNKNKETAKLEKELLNEINKLNIGPMGFGGKTTALSVHIEKLPCHIASLPVAVNIQCHSARHKMAGI